jgi:ribosomal protein S18 acetylase RimI-like enzyme
MIVNRITKEDLPALKEISDEQFGYNYLNKSYLESFLNKENLGMLARNADEIVGFTLIKIDHRDKIAAEFLVGEEFIKEKFTALSKIALRKHLAVKKGFEHQGIGTLLVENGMAELQKFKIDAILSIVWKEGSSKSLHNILTKHGSMPMTTFENYWAADSLLKNYICPACQIIPCTCSAILYSKSNV